MPQATSAQGRSLLPAPAYAGADGLRLGGSRPAAAAIPRMQCEIMGAVAGPLAGPVPARGRRPGRGPPLLRAGHGGPGPQMRADVPGRAQMY